MGKPVAFEAKARTGRSGVDLDDHHPSRFRVMANWTFVPPMTSMASTMA
jgi:hypothetical protein